MNIIYYKYKITIIFHKVVRPDDRLIVSKESGPLVDEEKDSKNRENFLWHLRCF